MVRSFEKHKRVLDKLLLKNISKLPCLACGRHGPSDPHHVVSKKSGGGDTIANVIPLCGYNSGLTNGCHRKCHDQGRKTFFNKHAVLIKWAKENGKEFILD